MSPHGAGTRWKVIEFDHDVVPGATNATAVAIPSQAQVIGVTGRVVGALTGSGLDGLADRCRRVGQPLRLGARASALNSVSRRAERRRRSPTMPPTPLLLTAEGGSFASGTVRLAMHVLQLEPPRAV